MIGPYEMRGTRRLEEKERMSERHLRGTVHENGKVVLLDDVHLLHDQDLKLMSNISKHFAIFQNKPLQTMLHGRPAAPVCFVISLWPIMLPATDFTWSRLSR